MTMQSTALCAMRRLLPRPLFVFAALATAVGMLPQPAWLAAQTPAAVGQPDAAVERARKQARMLDGMYKNAIVLVTTHYVTEKSDTPAGVAFKKLFETAKKEGWHEVRLIDTTGDPYEPANVAKSDFEIRAVKELLAGKAYVDQVVESPGKRQLLVATAVPVVMQKCTLCHEHYAKVPAGKPVGALSYIVPIE
jgi:hypothetical protein